MHGLYMEAMHAGILQNAITTNYMLYQICEIKSLVQKLDFTFHIYSAVILQGLTGNIVAVVPRCQLSSSFIAVSCITDQDGEDIKIKNFPAMSMLR